ncbi:SusD/RagB family nutrient-binding outer membrane lipoprotein [Pedobacter metabolipauper]|uniref:SusD-like starch-binding protein associating with outer membrane n=1 Tax=Pedobacter metabolipauper TaxID=425513 RepID=A0A4R6SVE4_9SPHI|nr:SusD/RagB family nutrient-binding outer membrane lipoprotein [Pedobacter metabolipauper]TDQ09750.1 SusD-like starch-binding protein associating with outer membrane [Pedobacter metabolipauper]
MKKFIIYTAAVISLLGISSCEKGFLDVNTDPNNPTETTPNFLLPSIIANGLAMQGYESYQLTGLLTQNIGRRAAPNSGVEQYFLAANVRPFQDTYQIVGANIGPMISIAQQEGSPYYVGAGKIMYAMILAHATDLLGDIPYSEAFQPALTISPKYDSQEDIYKAVNQLLDEGVVELQKPASSNSRAFYITTPSISGDILYKGVTASWIKLAYSIKARQANHLTKKASYDGNAILTLIDKGITSNTEDAQLQYQAVTSTVLNSTNVLGPTRNNMSALTYGRYFIEMLNGKNLLGNEALPDDPRFPIMAAAGSTGTQPGANNAQALGTGIVSDFYTSWYGLDLGVLPVLTNAEVRFIEAEAAFRAGAATRDRAYAAYIAGIRAHMDKIGVAAAARDLYIASPAVAQSAAALTLKNIMEQKYIALFMNPESWADMRKLDYDPTIYTGFYYPVGANPNAKNLYPRRTLYPLTEIQLNPAEVEKQGANAPDYLLKPLWWNQP